ncbi:hypothetical protein F52700_6594 [Fusarium sp. NRRL 52700]|nr:hypothetical protein F52700_6594 [Fusarium sp. NRRL 52700]
MPANTPATRREAQSPTVDSQRLKKRESDRKAQRVSRERTKSRIAYLEDLVQKLSSGDDHDKTLSLMAQLSEVTKQRDSLVRFLDSTSSSFTRHLSEVKKWESRTASQEQPQEQQPSVSGSVHRESPALLPDLLETPPASNELSLFSPDLTGIFPGDTALEGGQACMNLDSAMYSASHGHPVNDKTSAASSPCDCTSSETRRLSNGSVVSRNIWQAGNQVLKGPPGHLSTAMLELEDETSEDVPVRVVLYGWDHLEQSGRMTPLWRRIRHLDEICFSGCRQVERLAVIHMVHRYMRAYADPTSSNVSTILPRWYMKSVTEGTVSDPSQGGEDDQGWGYDAAVGEYNWDLDNF